MKQLFGTLPDGREVFQYTLTDGVISCDILPWGATVRALRVPDRQGKVRDILLGLPRLEDFFGKTGYLGATVGRYANRIGGAAFTLDGVTYPLAANNGKNHLHGGLVGFDRQLWNVEDESDTSLTLRLVSPDGQEGYPGNLTVTVRYAVQNGSLGIEYTATTDKPTLCNLTNHSYFNLNGHDSGDVLDQIIQIHATRYTPSDAGSIPLGELAEVTGTPMDLREPTPIGAHIDADFWQLNQADGYDHNYMPDGSGLREIAMARSEESGIEMRVFSTQHGVQFYSGNNIRNLPVGKDGAVYGKRCGFCLETQNFPDAPHHEHFPSAVLRPGEKYRQFTEYRFSVQK